MVKGPGWSMRLSRTASEALMDVLLPGGAFAWLLEYPARDPARYDLQLRCNPKTQRSWASLYLGLTSVLDVRECKAGMRLTAHPTHRRAGGFDKGWTKPGMSAGAWVNHIDAVRAYLERASAAVSLKHFQTEGRVQALLSNAPHRDFTVVNREVVVSFSDLPYKLQVIARMRAEFERALGRSGVGDKWWPGVANHRVFPSLGAEMDALGVDRDGRLLAIEVKPPSTVKGIGFGPAQVYFYAHLLDQVLRQDAGTLSAIRTMHDQRVALGLADGRAHLAEQPTIVPVLAIGAGPRSPHALPRAWMVHDELLRWLPMPSRVAPFEIWLLDDEGRVNQRLRTDHREPA